MTNLPFQGTYTIGRTHQDPRMEALHLLIQGREQALTELLEMLTPYEQTIFDEELWTLAERLREALPRPVVARSHPAV